MFDRCAHYCKLFNDFNIHHVLLVHPSGEAMNIFLNQNAAEIIEEMKPAASASIGKHFKSFLNAAFLQIPLKVWLTDADDK